MSTNTGRDQQTAVLAAPTSELASEWASLEVGHKLQTAAPGSEEMSPEVFDPGLFFDRWLDDVQSGPIKLIPEPPEDEAEESLQFFMESLPGSNSEVTFEGVLHFNGCSIGNIRSPEGTLVLTERGRIEADIDVGVAVINGSVIGNITAAQRVLLDSNARVTGQIVTPLLTVRLGAVFDGDCAFTSSLCSQALDFPDAEQPAELRQMVASA